MICDGCSTREATVCAVDLPENDGGLIFGDPILGLMLCDRCLAVSETDGPWSSVEPLVEVAAA